MSQSHKETILEKIAKLRQITVENGASEAEAINAALRMQEILMKYNIDISEVKEKDEEGEIIHGKTNNFSGAKIAGWKHILMNAVAVHCMCEIYYEHNKYFRNHNVVFVGKSMNVNVAKQMYSYLFEAIERLAVISSVAYKRERGWKKFPDGTGKSWLESWKQGCATRIRHRLSDRRKTMFEEGMKHDDGTITNAIIVKNTFEKELTLAQEAYKKFEEKYNEENENEPMGSNKANYKNPDEWGFDVGYRDGNKIGLDTQLTESTIPKVKQLN